MQRDGSELLAEPVTPQAGGQAEASEGDVRDIARELEEAEEVAAEHVTAVLTSALDHLGAAHHRPFSRG